MYIEDFYKPIVTKFFKLLINEVEELNDKRKAKDKLNTAFLIAPLAQDINYHFEKYADFAEDLRYLGLVCAEVISNDYKDQVKANIYIDEEEKYYYEIIFDSDTSYLGYCECIKTDKGYREDKQCCGYDCDWDYPTVEVRKVQIVSKHDWEGTQHEYWNFEDEFFDKNDKAKRERIKKESKIRIEFIQNEIKRMQDELKEIECKM